MSKSVLTKVILAAALIAFLAAAPALAQKSRQAGNVYDENGKPMEGVKVLFDRVEVTAGMTHLEETTNAEGYFSFAGIVGGKWRLSITVENYKPYSQVIEVSYFDRNDVVEIRLEKMQLMIESSSARDEAQKVIAKAQALVDEGKADEAIAAYMTLYEKYPTAHTIMVYIGDIYLNQDAVDKALDAYQAVLNEEPNNLTALKRLGDHYVKSYEYPKALEYYSKLADFQNTNPGILFIAGEVANSAGEYDAAVRYYEQFLALESDTSNAAQAYVTVGYIYTTKGECDKAEEAFKRYINLVPDPATEAALEQEVENCRKSRK